MGEFKWIPFFFGNIHTDVADPVSNVLEQEYFQNWSLGYPLQVSTQDAFCNAVKQFRVHLDKRYYGYTASLTYRKLWTQFYMKYYLINYQNWFLRKSVATHQTIMDWQNAMHIFWNDKTGVWSTASDNPITSSFLYILTDCMKQYLITVFLFQYPDYCVSFTCSDCRNLAKWSSESEISFALKFSLQLKLTMNAELKELITHSNKKCESSQTPLGAGFIQWTVSLECLGIVKNSKMISDTKLTIFFLKWFVASQQFSILVILPPCRHSKYLPKTPFSNSLNMVLFSYSQSTVT